MKPALLILLLCLTGCDSPVQDQDMDQPTAPSPEAKPAQRPPADTLVQPAESVPQRNLDQDRAECLKQVESDPNFQGSDPLVKLGPVASCLHAKGRSIEDIRAVMGSMMQLH